MIDLERQKDNFKNHIAKLTDYGNIKILDFKNPESSAYRIRFLFEEDYCRLHISGDLGELIATNYYNMTFEGFSDFVNNVGYFEGKIDCHSRNIYTYDEDKARDELKKIINEYELLQDIMNKSYYDDEKDALNGFLDGVLEDFDSDRGVGSKGYDVASEIITDFWEEVSYLGREKTGILELYMLAFELATRQLTN